MKTKINPWWLIPPALVAGLAIGIIFFGNETPEEHDHETEMAEGIVYTCSMHPQIRQDGPGKCPICGMDLVPVSEGTEVDDAQGVRLSGSAVRLGNVETVQAGFSGTPEETLTLNGKVVADENQVRSQSTHVAGRIERLFVNTQGEQVRRGQRIATLYSPPLIAAQQELLQAADMQESQPRLLEAAREKLRSLRLTDRQINDILASGSIKNTMDIYAEYTGTVLEKKVNVGDHVENGEVLYVLSDLSKVWVEFDAYESDLPMIEVGDEITFTVAGLPGQSFRGKVSFIDPVVESNTRVARVRVEMQNPQEKLKPQMFVRGQLIPSNNAGSDRLVIPRSAVLWTGQRSVVYEKTGTDDQGGAFFRLQEVVLGPATGDYYVVESGLAPGAEIVVNGTFTVDAAAQLAGKPSMMNADEARIKSAEMGTAPKTVQEGMATIIRSYTTLKDHLVASDFDAASAETKHLSEILSGLEATETDDAWKTWWQEFQEQVNSDLRSAMNAENIDALRAAFIDLSEHLVEAGKVVSPLDVPLYVLRCPMANNNEGARWLSLENEVKNPYYGEMMLTCGSVIETIE